MLLITGSQKYGWPCCSAIQLVVGILVYVGLHSYLAKLSVRGELAF